MSGQGSEKKINLSTVTVNDVIKETGQTPDALEVKDLDRPLIDLLKEGNSGAWKFLYGNIKAFGILFPKILPTDTNYSVASADVFAFTLLNQTDVNQFGSILKTLFDLEKANKASGIFRQSGSLAKNVIQAMITKIIEQADQVENKKEYLSSQMQPLMDEMHGYFIFKGESEEKARLSAQKSFFTIFAQNRTLLKQPPIPSFALKDGPMKGSDPSAVPEGVDRKGKGASTSVTNVQTQEQKLAQEFNIQENLVKEGVSELLLGISRLKEKAPDQYNKLLESLQRQNLQNCQTSDQLYPALKQGIESYLHPKVSFLKGLFKEKPIFQTELQGKLDLIEALQDKDVGYFFTFKEMVAEKLKKFDNLIEQIRQSGLGGSIETLLQKRPYHEELLNQIKEIHQFRVSLEAQSNLSSKPYEQRALKAFSEELKLKEASGLERCGKFMKELVTQKAGEGDFKAQEEYSLSQAKENFLKKVAEVTKLLAPVTPSSSQVNKVVGIGEKANGHKKRQKITFEKEKNSPSSSSSSSSDI